MNRRTSIILILSLWASLVWAEPATKPDPAAEYFAHVNQLASQGDVASQACLGELYGQGIGVKLDYEKQFHLESMAADKGSDDGKLDVAKAYAWGIGVQQDPKKALATVQELVAKGYAPAETTLGIFYITGAGVAKDYDEGVRWLKKAAAAGDFEAEVRLALLYHWGEDVKSNPTQAQLWLDKAAKHKVDCAAKFFLLSPFIINGYMNPNYKGDAKEVTDTMGIKFVYKDGKAQDITVVQSSGDAVTDARWVQGIHDTKFPPWPEGYDGTDKTMILWIAGNKPQPDPAFVTAVRDAIKSAVLFPQEAVVGGSKDAGKATVEFDYLDGSASGGKITISSGEPSEDAAALTAVANAKYPVTPKKYAHQKLHMSITLNFQKVNPPGIATGAVPAANTH